MTKQDKVSETIKNGDAKSLIEILRSVSETDDSLFDENVVSFEDISDDELNNGEVVA